MAKEKNRYGDAELDAFRIIIEKKLALDLKLLISIF